MGDYSGIYGIALTFFGLVCLYQSGNIDKKQASHGLVLYGGLILLALGIITMLVSFTPYM